MKKYTCVVCGYVYDPAVGDPDNGVAPGTALPMCPMIGPARSAGPARMNSKKPDPIRSGLPFDQESHPSGRSFLGLMGGI